MNIPSRNIAIVAGGDSSEWVVSMKSADALAEFLNNGRYTLYRVIIRNGEWDTQVDNRKFPIDKNNFSTQIDGHTVRFDYAYITIHGTPGENGILQGYFDLLRIPYSSCGVLASSLTFDKFTCNNFLKSFGFRIAKSMVVATDAVSPDEVVDTIGLPCFVKPNAGGSSFGITKVKHREEIQPAIRAALAEGSDALIESFIDGREITCGCYKTDATPVVLPLTEAISKNDFFDFEAKYTASKVEEITPAQLDESVAEDIREMTRKIYQLIGAKGIIRIDYILSGDQPYVIDVNTTPGMTPTSFIPQQVKAAGINITELLTAIVESEF